MSGKKSKAKAKKEKLKQDLQVEKEKKGLISAANQVEDQLEMFRSFKVFDRNGLDLTLEYWTPEKLAANPQLFQWAFDLTKKHMEHIYEQGTGWNDVKKKNELKSDESRFIFVFERETHQPVAFVHFRFEYDDNRLTVYIYEIQVELQAQRKGLGKFLMQIVELIARKNKMEHLILTVQKENESAMRFYTERLGFQLHEYSPSMADPVNTEHYHYEILIKHLVKPVAKSS